MPVSGQSLDPSTQTHALETAQSVKDVQEGGGYTDSDTGVAEGKIGRKKTRREGRRTGESRSTPLSFLSSSLRGPELTVLKSNSGPVSEEGGKGRGGDKHGHFPPS